ncbi:unnamed protein product [Caretta caretta]
MIWIALSHSSDEAPLKLSRLDAGLLVQRLARAGEPIEDVYRGAVCHLGPQRFLSSKGCDWTPLLWNAPGALRGTGICLTQEYVGLHGRYHQDKLYWRLPQIREVGTRSSSPPWPGRMGAEGCSWSMACEGNSAPFQGVSESGAATAEGPVQRRITYQPCRATAIRSF